MKTLNDSINYFIANVKAACFQYTLRPDGSDHIMFLNRECENLWEIKKEIMQGDTAKLWSMVFESDLDEMKKSISKSAYKLSVWNHEWRIKTPGNKVKYLKANGFPEKTADGTVIWSTIIEDVTQRIELDRENRRLLDRAANLERKASLSELASHIGHELGGPLTVIDIVNKKFQSVVNDGLINDEKLVKNIQRLETSSQRINDIVKSLRLLASDVMVSGDEEHIIILDSISEVYQIVKFSLNSHHINFDFKEVENDICVKVRKTDLQQVLLNLINNSIYAIKGQSDSWIKLSAREVEENVEIMIIDSGEIDESIRDKMFVEHFTTKPSSEGTGLGLMLVKKFVTSMNGLIEVVATEKNTTIKLTLPKCNEIRN